MKATIAGVLALLVGLAIGFGISMSKINTLRAELETARERTEKMEADSLVHKGELAELEAKFDRLRQELEEARSAHETSAETAVAETPPVVPDTSEFLAQLAEALGEQQAEPGRRRGGRFGERFEERDRRSEEEDVATRDERRRTYMDEFRQRMADFLTAEIESSDDPAEKQRIASISEYMQSVMEQRRLLREAQTDEERQAVFDTMRQNAEVLRSMVEEQQDQVMRDSLERQGITSRSEQDAVIQAYKEAEDDPFFQRPFTFFGGRGYGMRGRGGPSRGGGGPP